MDNETLTARQVEVLCAVANTSSQKEAALELLISHSTVKKHMEEIEWRLRVPNATRAVVVALLRGYITLDQLTDEPHDLRRERAM
jgi:two-component system response regulator DegU